jgi:Tol biopolymer transport system component
MLRLIAFVAILFTGVAVACAASPEHIEVLIADHGGRVDWGVNNLIALDQQDKDGWFQVWTMKPDGTSKHCVTCGKEFPKLHNGNPAWHPSGKYIVFQSLDENIKVPRLWEKLYRLYTGPGAGVNNNIWIASANGKRAWQMTVLGKGKGVLHPHFSHDGKTLIWAEMTNTKPAPFGSWVIRKAAFTERRDGPALTDVETLMPGNLQFYETHGFTPDDQTIVFTGKKAVGKGNALDIYKYNLGDRELELLTDPKLGAWDEHAQVSPDGSKILWMSSMDITPNNRGPFVKTDYWIMNIDGSNKRRITRFNDKSAPEYLRGTIVCADSSWSPDGKKFIGYVEHNSTATKAGDIVVVGAE